MANALTLTSLTEIIYAAKDRIAREPTGFLQGVMVNSGSEGVSINGTVTSHRTAEPTLNTSFTPAMTIPAADDQTVAAETLTIGQVANVRIPMRGEDMKKIDNTTGRVLIEDMIAQAIRKIVNTVEAHVGSVIYKGASRATGSAGTTPFGSNFNSIADLRQILVDNGTPMDGDVSLVINTSAGTKLRQLANLYKANEAGGDNLLRRGELLNLQGFSIRESAGVASHTKGTGSGYLVDLTAGYSVGDRTIHVDTGTGTILAGDVLAFESDTNAYVVGSGFAGDGDGDISLNYPGLRAALANNKTVTIGNNYTANVGFHRAAVELAIRPPAMPEGGDAASDRMTVVDDVTGLAFEVAIYKGYGMNMLEITSLYGAKVWKPEFVATLLG